MKKAELKKRVDAVIDDTKTALQTVYDNLNNGQRKKLEKVPEIKELFERYGIGGG